MNSGLGMGTRDLPLLGVLLSLSALDWDRTGLRVVSESCSHSRCWTLETEGGVFHTVRDLAPVPHFDHL